MTPNDEHIVEKEVSVSITNRCQVKRCETCVVLSDRSDIVGPGERGQSACPHAQQGFPRKFVGLTAICLSTEIYCISSWIEDVNGLSPKVVPWPCVELQGHDTRYGII